MEITLRAGKAQSFECCEYGYKLHFPKGSLPEHLLECKIHVRVFLSGQYEFPENAVPISAMYQITCPVELKEPVLLEIQHCAIIETPEQASFLSFVRAEDSNGQLPYQFNPISGGVFPVNGDYAAISVEKFSLYSIIKSLVSFLSPWQSEEDGPRLDYHFILYVTPISSKPRKSWEVICVLIKHNTTTLTVSKKINSITFSFLCFLSRLSRIDLCTRNYMTTFVLNLRVKKLNLSLLN